MAQMASSCFNIPTTWRRSKWDITETTNLRTTVRLPERQVRPAAFHIHFPGWPLAGKSVSVDISIPHQGLCMCPCLFLKWLSFHSLCVATAFSCCKSQLECRVRDAIFDHPIRFFYHFLSQLVFFLHSTNHILKLFTLPFFLPTLTFAPWGKNSSLLLTVVSPELTSVLIDSYSSINTCWMNK